MTENILFLISSSLPSNQKLVSADFRNLTSSGENYGSSLLAVDVIIESNDEKEKIFLVAKKPPKNKVVKEMFNTKYSFPNEVAFYQRIIPCLQNFQKKAGVEVIDSFPEFYAAKVITDKSLEVSDDSVLLTKNIKIRGYDILNRQIGFRLEQAKSVLEKLSEMHATVIALKSQNPEKFKQEIEPHLQKFEIFPLGEQRKRVVKWTLDIIKDDKLCAQHLLQIEKMLLQGAVLGELKNSKVKTENEFCSLVHADLWTNNIMVKMEENAVDVKFVDFQLYEYASLTSDVVFFIYSSVEYQTLKENCDFLLEFYFDSFIKHLATLKMDVTIYSYKSFLEEVKTTVQDFELFHILTMLTPIYAPSTHTKEVEELDIEDFTACNLTPTQQHKERACFIVKDFIKRNWLYQ